MKVYMIFPLLALMLFSCESESVQQVLPSPEQLAYQQMEMVGFIHFTVNSFTDKEFKGSQTFPIIAKHGPNPGTHWELIDKFPDDHNRMALLGILYGGHVNLRQALLSKGNTRIAGA